MALEDKTLKVGNARFYTAASGTPRPVGASKLKTPGSPWVEVGNTSLDNIIALTSEGGSVTTLGSLQNRSLRQNVDSRTESFGINLLDWTTRSLKYYYGANAVIAADGAVEVPSEPVPTEEAFLVVLEDGSNIGGFYAEKSSIFRSDDIAIADSNSLAQLPIKVTALNHLNKPSALTVIPPMPLTATPVTPAA